MATIEISGSLSTYYEDDCFSEPWAAAPETILLLHGAMESSRVWFAWVPHLSRRYRVLRPDLRGFGRSTIPTADHHWSLEEFARDTATLLDRLEVAKAHIVGAKYGGALGYLFAATYPEKTSTLTVIGGPVKAGDARGQMQFSGLAERIKSLGVRAFMAETQRSRLGSEVSEAQIEWWTDMMAESPERVVLESARLANQIDLIGVLPRIKAPTLVITAAGSVMADADTVRGYQKLLPDAELMVVPTDGYHIAASRPDETARTVLQFIERRAGRYSSSQV